MKLQGSADVMKRSRDVQDLASLLFKFCERGAGCVERAFKINVNYSAESIGRHLFGSAQKISRSAVYNNVNLAEFFDRRRNRPLDFIIISHVSRNCERFPAPGSNPFGGWLKVLHLTADQRNTSAAFGQSTRNAARYPSASTRHERNATIQYSIS